MRFAIVLSSVIGVLVCILVFCSPTQNPYNDPRNVNVSFTLPAGHADSLWEMSEPVEMSLGIQLIVRVDTVFVSWGAGDSESIYALTPADVQAKTLAIQHRYTTPGPKTIVVTTNFSGPSRVFAITVVVRCAKPKLSGPLTHPAAIQLGSSYFFAEHDSAGSDLKYQWFRKAGMISSQLANDTLDTLWFGNVGLSDTGFYYCMISSPCGDTSTDTGTIVNPVTDHSGPTIRILSPAPGMIVSDPSVQIFASVHDPSGVAQVKIGGVIATLTDTQYAATVTLTPGYDTLQVVATDNSTNSNVTIDTLKLKYDATVPDSQPPRINWVAPNLDSVSSDSMVTVKVKIADKSGISSATANYAALTPMNAGDSLYQGSVVLHARGTNAITVSATDNSPQKNATSQTFSLTYDPTASDVTRPVIRFVSPSKDTTVVDGSVMVTVSATDANGIASVILNDTAASVATNGYYQRRVGLAIGSTKVVLKAQDGSRNHNSSADSITVKRDPTILDFTGPAITLVTPGHDSAVTNASSYTVTLTAKDLNGISRVKIGLGSDSSNVTNSNDTTFSGTIGGLAQNVYNKVIITAWDNSSNKNATRDTLYVKYDPTALDVTGPTIGWVSGDSSGQRILNGKITIVDSVVDPSGISSAYWVVNGVVASQKNMTKLSGNKYQLTDSLTKFGSNKVVISAVDNATTKNKDSLVMIFSYAPRPSPVAIVSPSDQATGVQNVGGVTLSWAATTDPDGSSITYIVSCGSNVNAAAPHITTNTSYALNQLAGATNYVWTVSTCTALDTVRSPAVGSWTFTTKNHPATILSFPNISTPKGRSVTFKVMASDSEGIKTMQGYQWNLSSMGLALQGTDADSVTFTAPMGAPSTFAVVVTILDTMGGTTQATASLTTIDRKPTITSIRPDDTIFVNDTIPMTGAALDTDGRITEVAWNYGDTNGTFAVVATPNATPIVVNAGHRYKIAGSYSAVLRVKDDDGAYSYDTTNITVGKWVQFGSGAASPTGCSATHIAFDPAGVPYLCYVAPNPGGHPPAPAVMVSNYDGSAWNTLGSAISTIYTGQLSFAVDNVGSIFVVYLDQGAPVLESWGGSTWSSVVTLPGGATSVCLTAWDYTPYVGYVSGIGVQPTRAHVWANGGDIWQSDSTQSASSIAMMCNSTPDYLAISTSVVMNQAYSDGGISGKYAAGSVVFPDATLNMVIVPINGIPFVAFQYGSSRQLGVKTLSGGAWVNVGTNPVFGGTTSNIQLAAMNGQPCVAFRDVANGNKISLMSYDGVKWNFIGPQDFSPGSPADLGMAVFNNMPYVAYSDGANGNAITVMRLK